MKERPILFTTPMVKAVLDGRKTMTRRIMKPQPIEHNSVIKMPIELDDYAKILKEYQNQGYVDLCTTGNLAGYMIGKCLYGQPGDRLWVKETFRLRTHNFPTGWLYEYRATAEQDGTPTDGPWKSPRIMPKAASRIWLEITAVRVERLQEISEEDAEMEGVQWQFDTWLDYLAGEHPGNYYLLTAKESFITLWKSIKGPESWAANPWVWVIEFKRTQP